MNKENHRGNTSVKLFLLFYLVMTAIGLSAASHSASLNVGGEILYFGKDFPYTQQYACGAVATYAEKETGANFGHFTLVFTHDATIKGENYARPSAPADQSYYAIRTTQAIDVYLNGHAITVLPAGKEDSPEKWLARIYADGNVNIHGGSINAAGMGALDVQQGYIGSYNSVSIHGAIVNISEGNDETEVMAIKSGVTGSLTVSDSYISISGYSKLIQAQHGFSCTGSMLDLVSRKSAHGDSVSDTAVVEDGNYQIGGRGISLSGSVVSIVSEHPGMSGIRPRGELLVENSCVAIVSDRSCFRLDGYSSSSTGCQTFRNARMTAISTTGNVLSGAESDSEKSVATFGSGEYVFGSSGNKQGGNLMDDPEYYLNPEGKIAALVSGRIVIDGGNLEICAPNAYGCDTHEFTMKDGSLKMVDSIDHSKTVHAILDETAVKETISANAQFAGWTAEHSQMLQNMLDHLAAANVGTFEGWAGGVIETERFFQSGGSIDQRTAMYGGYIESYDAGWNWMAPVFTGGSLRMDFRYFYNKFGVKEYRAMIPINDLGQTLVRVDYEPYWIVDSTSQTQTIGEALGVPGVEWGSCDTKYTLKIDRDWTCDGNGSVRTDDMSFQAERRCGISLKVKGPTSMKFCYSKSFSAATFVVDCGSDFLYKDDMPGIKTEWKQVILDIPAGEQTVYIYARPGYFFFNEENEYNGFWIDDLQFGDFEHEKVYLIDYDQGPGSELTTSAAQARPYSNPLTYTASDLPLVLADAKPLKDGYEFVGWSMDGKMVTEIPKGTTGNIQLVAVWDQEEYPNAPQLSWTNGVSRLYETLDLKYIWPKPYVGAAAVYDGYLSDADGIVRGTIQVKVAKGKTDRKTGKFSAKVTATVQLADGSKKISFKGGVVDSDVRGLVSAMSVGGHVLNAQVGEYGLGGTMDGLTIDGARNVFIGKYEGDGAFADGASGCMGVYNLAGERGVLSVSVAKKGKVKISGTVNGVKVSATSQLLVGNEVCCIPIVIAKKTSLALNLLISKDGKDVMVRGVNSVASGQGSASPLWAAGKAGQLEGTAKFTLADGGAAGVRTLLRLFAEYLPNGIDVAVNGTKWIVAGGAKAGKLTLSKGTSEIDPEKSKFTENMSGLKLTYKQKDGTFKGSFKMYGLESGKIKAYTASVTGVMIGAKGYGTATIKKPSCLFAITIE